MVMTILVVIVLQMGLVMGHGVALVDAIQLMTIASEEPDLT